MEDPRADVKTQQTPDVSCLELPGDYALAMWDGAADWGDSLVNVPLHMGIKVDEFLDWHARSFLASRLFLTILMFNLYETVADSNQFPNIGKYWKSVSKYLDYTY